MADGRLDVRLLGPVEVHADGRAARAGRATAACGRRPPRARPWPRRLGRATRRPPVGRAAAGVATGIAADHPLPVAPRARTGSRAGRPAGGDRVRAARLRAPRSTRRGRPDPVPAACARRSARRRRGAAPRGTRNGSRRRWPSGAARRSAGSDRTRWSRPIAVALEEERLAVVQDRFDVLLALGLHVEAVAELSVAVSEQPLKEGLWSALAIALVPVATPGRRAAGDRSGAAHTWSTSSGSIPDRVCASSSAGSSTRIPHCWRYRWRPHQSRRSPTPRRSSDVRFVGRTEEWARLVAALDRAEQGAPSLVMVEGEAGIGKSAIAERLLAHAAGRGWQTSPWDTASTVSWRRRCGRSSKCSRDLGVAVDPGDTARVSGQRPGAHPSRSPTRSCARSTTREAVDRRASCSTMLTGPTIPRSTC